MEQFARGSYRLSVTGHRAPCGCGGAEMADVRAAERVSRQHHSELPRFDAEPRRARREMSAHHAHLVEAVSARLRGAGLDSGHGRSHGGRAGFGQRAIGSGQNDAVTRLRGPPSRIGKIVASSRGPAAEGARGRGAHRDRCLQFRTISAHMELPASRESDDCTQDRTDMRSPCARMSDDLHTRNSHENLAQ